MLRWTLAPVMFSLLIISGCVKFKQITEIPQPSLPTPPLPESESHVTLPVQVSGLNLNVINNVIPNITGESQIENIEGWGADYVNYLVWREPILLTLSGSTIDARFHPYFYISIGDAYDPDFQCGYRHNPAQERLIGITSTVAWSADWALDAHTTWKFLPLNSPDCILGFFHYNATSKINDILTNLLNNKIPEFDKTVGEKTNIRPNAAELWSALTRTVSLGAETWLQLRPTAAAAGAIASSAEGNPGFYTITSAVEVTGKPAIFFGAEPSPDNTPLPQLSGAVTGNEGFELHLDSTMPMSIAQAIIEKKFPLVFTAGRHKMLLKNPKLSASGSQVLLEVELFNTVDKRPIAVEDVVTLVEAGFNETVDWIDGLLWTAEGKAYFIGTPSFDVSRRDVYFPDLDFTEQSKSVLLNAVDWVLHTLLVELLRSEVRLNFGDQIDGLFPMINEGVNRQVGGARLTGYTNEIKPESIFVVSDGIVGRFKATGHLAIYANAGDVPH